VDVKHNHEGRVCDPHCPAWDNRCDRVRLGRRCSYHWDHKGPCSFVPIMPDYSEVARDHVADLVSGRLPPEDAMQKKET
jgi:hypothetical protein